MVAQSDNTGRWIAGLIWYSLLWLWLFGCASTWKWPYSYPYFDVGVFELIFGTLVVIFFHFWLMPAVLTFGVLGFFVAAVVSAIGTFLLVGNYLTSDDKGNVFALLGPIATGAFAYWGIPTAWGGLIELNEAFIQWYPIFFDWLSDNLLFVIILYAGPILLVILANKIPKKPK